jgi:catechol 2,3-dioxygenase-like lactoylglutathione lyase family enzyme
MNCIYHVGLVVPQLEAAIEQYSKALGVTFRPPVSRTYGKVDQHATDGHVYNGPFEGRFTYSVEGPPHIELMEASGEGIWAATGEQRFHHFGMWSDNPQAQAQKMERIGFRWEAKLYSDDGSIPIVFVRKDDIRIELLSENRKPNFRAWVEGQRDGP